MNKEQMQVLKDAKENLEAARDKLGDEITTVMADVDRELENVVKIKDDLQEVFDEMDEKQQDSDKGQKLSDLISSIENIESEINSLKDALESDPFDDILTALSDVIEAK